MPCMKLCSNCIHGRVEEGVVVYCAKVRKYGVYRVACVHHVQQPWLIEHRETGASTGIQWKLWGTTWVLFKFGVQLANLFSLEWCETQSDRGLLQRRAREMVRITGWYTQSRHTRKARGN